MLLSLLLPVAPPVAVPEPHLLAQSLAQSVITPNADAVGTVVQQQSTAAGTQLMIEGGTTTGSNLFHSFDQFTLEAGDTANFVATPQIDNILGRINGGRVSELDGTLQISGSTANLFLMNPAGIVFGPKARLNLPAAFTATTGDGIGFGNDIFRAFGDHDFSQFEGSPDSILFSETATGNIINSGNLSLGADQLLRLVGNSVISSGQLIAGQVQVAGTAGKSGSGRVTFARDGLVLSLDLSSESLQPLETETLDDIRVQGPGNVAVQEVMAQSASLTAANHLILEASQLRTTGDLTLVAGHVLRGRDTTVNPFILQSGGDLRIQGNNGIDIFALNHPQTQIQSGGDLSLISNGLISGDAQFFSGGDFSIATLAEQPGRFVSLNDPIIRSQGDITFGDYIGAALKVEAEGSINGGDIRIAGPDTSGSIPVTDPDFVDLTTRPSVILRAGESVAAPSSFLVSEGLTPTPFEQSSAGLGAANLTVVNLDTSINGAERQAGNVILSAPGTITAGDINASATGDAPTDAFGGNVLVQAGGSISVGAVSTVSETFSLSRAQAGNVVMTAGEDLTFDAIQAQGIGISPLGPGQGIGGTVQLTATGVVRGQAIVDPVNPANRTTIDTTGNLQSGGIAISHGGGADNIPFVVGDAVADNGTAGKLQSGSTVVFNQTFSKVGREGVGSMNSLSNEIVITFTNQAPVLEGDRTISTETNTDVSLTLADLSLDITDSDGDNTTVELVELDSISAGATLSRGGIPLNPGDAIAPSDTLTYSPPADISGSVLAFSLRGSDRLEASNTIDITASIDSVAAPIDPPPVIDPGPPTPGPAPEPTPGPAPGSAPGSAPGLTLGPTPGPAPTPTPLAPEPTPDLTPDPNPVPAAPDPDPPGATPLVVTPEPSVVEPPSENPAPDLSPLQLLGQLGDSLGQDLQAQPDGAGDGGVLGSLSSLSVPAVQENPLAAFPDTQAPVLSDLTIFSAMVPEASLALLPQGTGGIDPTILKQNDINTPDIPAMGSIKDREISTISGPVGDFPGDSGDGLVSGPSGGGTTSVPQPGYEPDVPIDIPQSGTPISAPQPGIEPDVPGGTEGSGSNNPGSGNAGNPPVEVSNSGQTGDSSIIASATNEAQQTGPSASTTSPSVDNGTSSDQASSTASPAAENSGTSNPESARTRNESVNGDSGNGDSGNGDSGNGKSGQSQPDATSTAGSTPAAANEPQAIPTADARGARSPKEQNCQAKVAQTSYEQVSADPTDAAQKNVTAAANPSAAAASKSDQQGHYRNLVTCYQATLAQARQTQDRGSQFTALNNLGIAHFVLGEYLQAIEVHQQQLQQAEAEGDRTQIGIAWAGLGAAHAALGDYDRAIDEYQQSLDNLPDSDRVQPWRSLTLRNLGNAYLSQKDYSQALQYQQQALELSKSVGDRYGEMQALGNLANVYALDAQFDRALEYYQQNLMLARSQNVLLEQAQALLGLGTTHAFLKDYRQAIDYNQQSLALVRSLDNRLSEGILLTNLGDAHYQLGELAPAERYLRQSIDVWEGLRAGLGTNDSYKISIFETQLAAYRNLQEVLLDQQKAGEALEIAERGRSRAFVELLARGRADDASAAGSNAAEAAALAPLNLEQLKAIAREQNATLVEYTIAREQFVNVPNGAALQYTGEAVPSKLLIWVLSPSGEVQVRQVDLLAWQIQQQQSLPGLVSVVRRCMDDLSCTRLFNRRQRRALARALAQRGLKPLQEASRAPQTSSQQPGSQEPDAFSNGTGNSQNSSQNSLQQLYGLLIEPIADLLPQNPSDRIVFVPQEQLFLVPFPALQASDGTYLIDKHTVTTAPSIQVLAATRRRRQQLAQQLDQPSKFSPPSDQQNPKQNSTALVVGNPAPMPAKFSPLPFTAEEAETIGQALNAEPLIGAAATEAAVKRQLPQARWIHLATHGIFDPKRPLDGAIILAPEAQTDRSNPLDIAKDTDKLDTAVLDATSAPQDGLLTAGEIMDLSLQAEMVILSACDTGRGRITGDGVIGLSRSFLGAGAASVLVSLWQVPDDATASLMAEFYQQHQQLDYAQALRQAMLAVKADHSDPKSWAGFTLIGEVE